MIYLYTVNRFCCEDICLIENYEKAANDKTQTWDCHHKLEIELNLSRQELKDRNLYYDRPPSELIFMTRAEHTKLHKTGKNPEDYMTSETIKEKKRKISEKSKGKNNPMYGKPSAIRGKHRVYRADGTYYYEF